MAETPRVLVVTTSHDRIDDQHRTGLWLEEFSVPYNLLTGGGIGVTVASPEGGQVPIDPRSQPEGDPSGREQAALEALADTLPIDQVDAGGFDAVFFPGGHGTMFDLTDERVGDLVADFARQGKLVSAVCHGPAAFVSATLEDGTPFVEGKRLTAFSNAEERDVDLADAMPFLLESRLEKLGAEVETAEPYASHVVEDGDLITGQNPPSSEATAKALVSRLIGERSR